MYRAVRAAASAPKPHLVPCEAVVHEAENPDAEVRADP